MRYGGRAACRLKTIRGKTKHCPCRRDAGQQHSDDTNVHGNVTASLETPQCCDRPHIGALGGVGRLDYCAAPIGPGILSEATAGACHCSRGMPLQHCTREEVRLEHVLSRGESGGAGGGAPPSSGASCLTALSSHT